MFDDLYQAHLICIETNAMSINEAEEQIVKNLLRNEVMK